jgi:iron complex outermembrane recepter protein
MRAQVSMIALSMGVGLSGLGLAAPSVALAQTPAQAPAAAAQPQEVVIVTGQRGATQRARAEERIADTLINVVSADEVGQFGDQNSAEALQRLPGINIDRNEGEGRTVSVRGLPSAFTQITVNGARVGTSEAGDSSVALDVIPSDQLGSLAVAKTYTPDMDGDTIGGSIDLRSLSAFNSRTDQITVRVEGTYNEYADAWSPKASVSMTRKFADDKIGLALALNYQDRAVEGNDLRNDEDTGVLTVTRNGTTFYYPVEADVRREVGQRERLGGTFNLEFRPTDTSEYFLRGQYNTLKDDDIRIQYLVELDRSTGSEILGVTANSLDIIDARVRHQTFFQPTEDRLGAISVGGKNQFEANGELSYQLDFSRSRWTQEDGVRGRFQIDDVRAKLSWSDESVAIEPIEVEPARPPGSARDQRDPRLLTAYTFSNLLFIEEERIDDIVTGQINYKRDLSWGDRPGFIKMGAKLRDREKTADKSEFNGTPAAGTNYSNIELFQPESSFTGFGRFPTLEASKALYLNTRDALLANPNFNRRDQSVASDYAINERVFAAYLMGGVDLQPNMKLIGGFRFESTQFESTGYFLESNTDGLSATGALPTPVQLAPVTSETSHILPSLALRWDARDEVVVRASYGRGLKRGDFQDVANRQEIRFDGTGTGSASTRRLTAGNPNLKPLVADQFDASVAWYPNRDTALQVALFHKSITDFHVEIATNNIAETPIILPTGVSTSFPFGISTVINGGKANVSGAEISYNQSFTQLPGLLSGLFAEGNVTLATSEADVALRPNETFAFPGQADLTANVSLGWENEIFSARVSGTHTGERLAGLASAARKYEDRYRKAYTQLDVNLRWNLNDTFQIYADGINLNGAKEVRYYVGGGAGGIYERVQDFGSTYQVGVRARF